MDKAKHQERGEPERHAAEHMHGGNGIADRPGSVALPSASTFATPPAIAAPSAVPIKCTEDQAEAVLRCSSEPALSVPTTKTPAPSVVMLCAGPGHRLANRRAGCEGDGFFRPARPKATEVSNSSLFASRTGLSKERRSSSPAYLKDDPIPSAAAFAVGRRSFSSGRQTAVRRSAPVYCAA
jgi:hypothetical protein